MRILIAMIISGLLLGACATGPHNPKDTPSYNDPSKVGSG